MRKLFLMVFSCATAPLFGNPVFNTTPFSVEEMKGILSNPEVQKKLSHDNTRVEGLTGSTPDASGAAVWSIWTKKCRIEVRVGYRASTKPLNPRLPSGRQIERVVQSGNCE